MFTHLCQKPLICPRLQTPNFRLTDGLKGSQGFGIFSFRCFAYAILGRCGNCADYGGTFYDPQKGVLLDAQDAVAYSRQEAQRGAPPHDLREREFKRWPAED